MLIQLLISSRSILITYDFLHKQSCHLWAKTVLFLFSKSMYLLFLFAPLRLYLWLSFKFEGQFCQIKNFGWQVFPPPCTLNISVYWLLAYKDSAEKLADTFTKDPLYMMSIFSCAAFRIFSLSLVFNTVIIKCLEVSLFWFILLQVH